MFSTETVIETPEMTESTSCVWVLEAPQLYVLNITVHFRRYRFANKHCQWFQVGNLLLSSVCWFAETFFCYHYTSCVPAVHVKAHTGV